MQQAILVASFGTSHEPARRQTICAVEEEIRRAFPARRLAAAYTSPRIRKSLKARGVFVDAPDRAVEGLLRDGVRDITVQPTHVICGEEYDRLLQGLRPYQGEARIRVGLPLLSTTQDLQQAAALLCRRHPVLPDTCTVFMGHGTQHPANAVYPALAYMLQSAGRQDLFVATAEGYPALSDVLPQIQAAYQKVRLVPLMLAAGEHAAEDMAGDAPASWKSILEKRGLLPEPVLEGLGEDPGFRAFYVRHIRQAALLSEK